jgi:hypothetical protein
MSVMQIAIRVTTTVQPDGQVVIAHLLLRPGQTVEVIILIPPERQAGRESIIDILNSSPGNQLFKSAEEVDQYLREERDSWDS